MKFIKIWIAVLLFLSVLSVPSYAKLIGTDSFGYTCVDSEGDAPRVDYNWVDISETGRLLFGTSAGSGYGLRVDMGFITSYYGQAVRYVYVGDRGAIALSNYYLSGVNNYQLPSTSYPLGTIAPFWDYVYMDGDGRVYSQTIGTAPNRIFIVQYTNVTLYTDRDARLNFQVQLHEDGKVAYYYGPMSGGNSDGATATVGLENYNGTIGHTYSYNEPGSVYEGLAIQYSLPTDISTVYPLDSAFSLPTNTKPYIKFDSPLLEASVTEGIVSLVGSISGAIQGQLNYVKQGSLLEFIPSQQFAANETVTVSVGDGLTYADGVTIRPTSWSFTTGSIVDNTVPNAVTSLTATDAANDAGIMLNWTHSDSDDVAYYHVYRSNDPIEVVGGATPIETVASNQFLDEIKTTDTDFYYAVVPEDSSGNFGGITSVGPVQFIDDAPSAPELINGNTVEDGIYLYWDKPGDTDLAGYKVYYGLASGNYENSISTGLLNYLSLKNLSDCADYFIAVSAVDVGGNESSLSSEVIIKSGQPGSPSEPVNLTASSEESLITITWENQGECDLDQYYVYRSVTQDSGYTLVSTQSVQEPGVYQDKRIADGETYYYKIAVSDIGDNVSLLSSPIAEAAINAIPPSAPNIYNHYSYSNGYSRVYWYGNNDDAGDIGGYNFYYSEDGSSTEDSGQIISSNGQSGNGYIGPFSSCTAYKASVEAFDLSGNVSERSNEYSFYSRSLDGVSVPTNFVGASGDRSVDLTWDANEECEYVTRYYIYKSVDGVSWTYAGYTAGNSYTVNNLPLGINYFRILAYNGSQSPYTEPITVDILDLPPNTPEIYNVYDYSTQLRIYWYTNNHSVFDMGGYKLHYRQPGEEYSVIDIPDTYAYRSTKYYYLSGLETCKDYSFAVSAYDVAGNESTPSEEYSYRYPRRSVPPAPTGLNAVADATKVALSWDEDACVYGVDVGAISYYQIYRLTEGVTSSYVYVGQVQDVTFEDINVEPGNTYYYYVRSRNGYGFSPNSETTSVTFTATDDTPPSINALTTSPTGPHRSENVAFLVSFDESMDTSLMPDVVLDNGVLSYSVIGQWLNNTDWEGSYTFTPDTGDGNYTITVSGAQDEAGNVMLADSTYSLVLDTVPPSPVTVDSVTSPTNQTTQILNGFKEAGTAVLINGVEQIAIDNQTSWSYTILLTEGLNAINISSTDAAGNESIATSIDIVVDTIAPTVPSVDNLVSPTNKATQEITGSKESNTAIYINGAEVVGLNAETSWSYALTLELGDNELIVHARDAAGNDSDSLVKTITRDITAPDAPVVDEVVTPTNETSQVLAGTKPSNTSVVINGVEKIALDSLTTWSYSTTLLEGTNVFEILSKDLDGNESSAVSLTIVLDTVSPSEPTISDVSSPTSLTTQTVSGAKEAGTSLEINGVERVALNQADNWEYTIDLTEGVNEISVVARDAAGNKSSAAFAEIKLDTVPPSSPTINTVPVLTNKVSQIIGGTKETDTSIVVNGVEQVSINGEMSWSYTASLSEGANNIIVVARDAAGNESASASTSITLDTIAPVLPTFYSVTSPTNRPTQLVKGTKEENTILVVDGVEQGSVDSASEWQYEASLNEGENNITILTRDEVGNESPSATTSIVLDTLAPEIPSLNTIPSITNQSTFTISGGKEAETSVVINGIERVALDEDTLWSSNLELNEGSNNITIIARDAAGNESAFIEATVELDTIAPGIPTLNTVTTLTDQATQIISGTKDSGSAIVINGVEAVALNNETSWSFDLTLEEGVNNLIIASQDAAGNNSTAVTASITLDTIAPEKAVINPVSDRTNQVTQVISGTKEANTSLVINGENLPLSSETTWSYTVNLVEGNNEISVVARDEIGHESLAAVVWILLDTIPPQAPIIDPVPSLTNSNSLSISGSKEADTSLLVNGTQRVALNGLTRWASTLYLSEGNNDFTIVSQDVGGNESEAVTFSVALDTIAPAAPTFNTINSPAGQANQEISGTKEAGTSVVVNGNEAIALNSETVWSYLITLEEGQNVISVAVKDEAGNTSSTVSQTIELDLQPPAPVTGLVAEDVTYDAGGKISLTWAANTEEDLSHYAVYRSEVAFTSVEGLTPVQTVTTNSFIDSVTDNLDYFYAVTAFDRNNHEDTSVTSYGPIQAVDNAPSSPAGLQRSRSNNGIELNWYSNPETDIAGYRVYYGLSSNELNSSLDIGSLTNATLSGLTPCTTYYASVSAYDIAGNESQQSSIVSEWSGSEGAPEAPINVSATSVESEITLTWPPNAECDLTKYEVYRSSHPDSEFTLVKTINHYSWQTSYSYSDYFLMNGADYYYKVIAKDSYGAISNDSEVVNATAVDTIIPATPYKPRLSPTSNGINVRWTVDNSTKDYAGYNIYYGTESGLLDQKVTVATSPLQKELANLLDCTDYYVAVSAFDYSGQESELSEEAVLSSGQAGPPSSPSGLTATVEEPQIIVSWDANTECDMSRYYIERAEVDTRYWDGLRYTTDTSYIDDNVTDGRTYHYRVRARDLSNVYGDYSEVVSAVGEDRTPPEPVSYVVGSYNSKYKYIYVRWGRSEDPSFKHYRIYYGTTSGVYDTYKIDSYNSYTPRENIYGLNPGTIYYIAVSVVDKSGNESAKSEEISVAFGGSTFIEPPAGVTVESKESLVKLSWQENSEFDIAGYKVYRSTTSGGNYQQVADIKKALSYVDRQIVHGTQYFYVLKAYNYDGLESEYSDEVSTTAIDTTPPVAPPTLWLTLRDTSVLASWDASTSPDVAEYRLYYGNKVSQFTDSVTTTGTSLSLTDLAPCKKYYMVVTAIDYSGNESDYSWQKIIDINDFGAPAAPTDLTAELSNGEVKLSWSESTECDFSQYTIERSLTTGSGYAALANTTSPNYVDTGLNEGNSYYYRVKASDIEDKISDYSQEIEVVAGDLTPPVAPSIDDELFLFTNSETFVLGGTKETDASVVIDGVERVPVNVDQTWQTEVTLNVGGNSFTLHSVDSSGNLSDTTEVSVVRDIEPPFIESATPASGAIVNQLETLSIGLKDNNVSVDFASSAMNTNITGPENNLISGTWSFVDNKLVFSPELSIEELSEGIYYVSVNPIDELGNTGEVSYSFEIDTTKPLITNYATDSESPFKAESVVFTLTFNEEMDTSIEPNVVLGDPSGSNALVSGGWIESKRWQGEYVFTPELTTGEYNITVTSASDIAGNVLMPAAMGTFILDTVAPAQPTVIVSASLTDMPSQLLSGIKEADSAIVINGIERVALNGETSWSYTYPLTEGDNVLSVTARDEAGNVSEAATETIILDTTPPLFTIDQYDPNSAKATQTISGRKEAGAIVNYEGAEIFGADDQSETWSYEVTLQEGFASKLTFTADDALGNRTMKSITILYDSAAPPALADGALQADGEGLGTTVNLSWPTYAEPNDLAYYRVYVSETEFSSYDGLTSIGTVDRGSKSFVATGLTEGTTYYFSVEPVDSIGNSESTANTVAAIPIDTAAPEDVTGLQVTGDYDETNGSSLTLNWTASANTQGDLAGQKLYVDAGQGYDAGTVLATDAITRTLTGLSDNTVYKFRITTLDDGGLESSGAVVTASTVLRNPTGVVAVAGKNEVSLSWNSVTSPYLSTYQVYRVISGEPITSVDGLIPIKSSNEIIFSDSSLENGTTYQYAVTAVNTFGAQKTNVTSVAATPRADAIAPEISSLSVTEGQIISNALTISAAATDDESGISKLELYIDNELVKSVNGASLSWYWNILGSTDDNHIVKVIATDGSGNVVEETRTVIVSQAPPTTPSITSHSISGDLSSVTVSGNAPQQTTVTLKVGGFVHSTVETDASSHFSFTRLPLLEGDNYFAVKATHRGGDSSYSSNYVVNLDTGAPPAPTGLAANVLPGGKLQFTWQSGVGETPAGFNLYRSSSMFSVTTAAGVAKISSSPIRFLVTEITPTNDDLYYYRVSALDASGNESELSNNVSVASDRSAPAITAITFAANDGPAASSLTTGPANVTVDFTLSEKLAEPPFFSLEPQAGSPIVVSVTAVDDLHYSGNFRVDASTPHGSTTWKFSGKDDVGNRGNGQGVGPVLDTRGPQATVTSPIGLQQTVAGVTVDVSFDEAPVELPILEFTDTNGNNVAVTGLAPTTDDRHYSGTVDFAGLSAGQGSFKLISAVDSYGNQSSTVISGKYLQLYIDSPPAPPVPQGFTAQSQSGGRIALLWKVAEGAESYNLYRRVEGEPSWTLLRNQTATGYTDLPVADGSYEYAVSAVGVLESESELSSLISAVSDRIAPDTPVGLNLALGGDGVLATWAAVNDAANYELYRSANAINSVVGLSAVATSTEASATDTNATINQRHYVVTAVDAVGNQSAPSTDVSIDFPVAPVKSMALTRLESAQPYLSWQSDTPNLDGYIIYRNGSAINSTPTASTSYTDGYYTGGSATYGIAVVDTFGNTSPMREVVLPDLTIGVSEGTSLRRGLIETIPVEINSAEDVSVSEITIKVGNNAASTLNGPFDVAAGTPYTVEKVAATSADAQSSVPILATAILKPASGTMITISQSSQAQVGGASAALEVFNEPLVRGTQAQVRLKFNNLGTARTEFITSQNGGATSQVKVYLKDQDGNVLAQGQLNQRTGSQILNRSNHSVALVEPGQSFLSEPITFSVPNSAPYSVVLEAVIANTYYHYSLPDQVVAPGLSQSVDTTIAEVSYTATAAVENEVYKQGEAINITGQAIATTDGSPMPYVPVRLGISVKGFDRFYTLTTDSAGSFAYTFRPNSTEAGTYSVWAVHPELSDRSVQDKFDIIGLALNPVRYDLRMAKGSSGDVPFRLTNLGGAPLEDLSFSVNASSGLTASIVSSGSTILGGSEVRSLKLRVNSTASSPANGYVSVDINTAAGLKERLDVNVALFDTKPVISVSPSYIDTGLMRGTQLVKTLTVRNSGQTTLQNARIEGPSTSWMTLTVDRNIGSLEVGQSTSVGILFRPAEGLAPNVYDDRIVIYSDNHIPYTINLQATVTSNAVGNVQFDVLNELFEDVANASITLQHQTQPELIYSLKTAADGTVTKFDIPEGRYSYSVSASGHKPYNGSFVVTPGLTVTVPVALEVTLVEVEFSVTPITIEDRYEINITQTFETQVPTSVLVVEPPGANLPLMAVGEVYNGEFTITNYGLIAVDYKGLNYKRSFNGFEMEILGNIPATLGANEKVILPYRIKRVSE